MRNLCLALTVTLISIASYAATSDGPVQGPSPSTRTVTGTRIAHYKTGPVPIDLSALNIGAFAPNGSGGYNFFSGSGTSSGTFTIANVPGGFYLLEIGELYLWTSNTVVDADYNVDTRSDTVQADQNTTVTFDLTNLNSWQSTDFLEMVCPNNGEFNLFVGTVGDTTFTGTFPYSGPLSVGSEGDQYYIFQAVTQSVNSFPFNALGRYIAPPKFIQAQGSDTPISGTLRTIVQSHKFEANINGADLAAQALAANPNAALASTVLALDVYPGTVSKGEDTATPDLVAYDFLGSSPLITSNGDLGPVLYGNPFPSKWPLFDIYVWQAYTNYTAPGATNSTPIFTMSQGYDVTLPTSTKPIKPLVGVVNKPSINHKNFFADRMGVGTSPTLKWSPPNLGAANDYLVAVYQLANNGGNTTATRIGSLFTQKTSLLIPDGLLSAGQAYVFLIRARYVPGINFAKTPFVNGPVIASGDVISGLIQP